MSIKTFIYHDGALGDVLLSLSALAAIRACSGSIHLAGRADAACLLKDAGWVDEAYDAGSLFFSSLHTDYVSDGLRVFLSGFGMGVMFSTRQDSQLVRNLREIIPDTEIILTVPPEGVRMHVAEFRLGQLNDADRLSVAGKAKKNASERSLPVMKMSNAHREKAREVLVKSGHDFSRPLVGIHPGSGGRRKCWPFDNYIELMMKSAAEWDPFFILFSGPAEEEYLRTGVSILAGNNRNRITHLCGEELATVASLLSLCDLYVGNDSGISHLASLMKTQTIAIFGPTDPMIWTPIGERVKIISSREQCAPCGDIGSRVCKDRKCLSSISVEEVFTAVATYLDFAGGGNFEDQHLCPG